MKTPTRFQLEYGLAHLYDPVKAHEYYLKNRELTGRKKAGPKITEDDPRWNPKTMGNKRGSLRDPRTGKTTQQIHNDAVAKQKKELKDRVDRLDAKLKRLDAKIAEMERKESSADRKSTAKKERSRKEAEKPKTAAEKAKAARENAKYRDKHKQELKSKKSSSKSGGGSKKKGAGKPKTLSELKTLATRVRGQLALAKIKLAAL